MRFNSLIYFITVCVVLTLLVGWLVVYLLRCGTVRLFTQMRVKLEVVGVEFDADQCELRVKGRNIQENEFIKVL